jgi:lipopolysaccharide/colanic/teichoic acid biosynthesis glycosyltransferase
VTTTFDQLSLVARAALRKIEASTPISVDFIAEKLFIDSPSCRVLRQVALPAETKEEDGPLFNFSEVELQGLRRRPYWRVKRAMDAIGAMVLIGLLLSIAPLLLVIVAYDVGWPLLFWQQRPGLDGRPFKLLKFRTMADAHDGTGKRISDVERLSSIGKFLRRTRLDELPQIWHILVGQMSFVGPRPLLPIDQSAAYAARLVVRPGLTGWAQVKGGRDISGRDKAALDVWYVKNASLKLDIEILLRTVPMVLLGERVSRTAVQRAWNDLRQSGNCRAESDGAHYHDLMEANAARQRKVA